MRQALHIFQKDVRRLWIQIALLMLAIGYFAWLDIRLSAYASTNSSGNLVIECVAGAMVWFLIARAVHEESLAGENQFWLTRPYERASLLGAKMLLVLAVAIMPFFLADLAILGGDSLPVGANLVGVLVRQFLTAAWLVLPPLAIASVTRSITEDVMVWIVSLAIAGLLYFPFSNGGIRDEIEVYWLGIAIVLMIVVLWRQYLRRGVVVSRALMAAAVLLPALPLPRGVAAALTQIRSNPASAISIAVKPGVVRGVREFGGSACAPVGISVNGVQPGWRVTVLAEQDTFTSENGESSRTVDWRPGGNGWNMANLTPCLTPDGLKELGGAKRLRVHSSLLLGVFAMGADHEVKATREPFSVPDVGRCQFQTMPALYYSQESYVLGCESPVWAPIQGNVLIDGQGTAIWYREYDATPLGMLPGMSPVYKWVTLRMNNQIRDALRDGGIVEFRPESRIAVLEREIEAKDVEF